MTITLGKKDSIYILSLYKVILVVRSTDLDK